MSLTLAFVMILSLAGCTIPTKGYADYDVTGYIRSLLFSSYYGDHEDYISFANTTEEIAQENNDVVVENGAIHFCNRYGLNPTDSQLGEIEDIIRAAYASSKFTVSEKIETSEGYDIDVEITPIVNFMDMSEIDTLKEKLEDKNNSSAEDDDVSNDDNESSNIDSSDNKFSSNSSSASDKSEELVDSVITLMKNEMNKINYGENTLITLKIKFDSTAGTLSLDQTQIEEIDEAVICFTSKS